ncbi:MAG: DNA-binding protein [Rikenellaceae bacterium]
MITAIEPMVAESGRYSVMQTAAALGIHRNSLRKYTDVGLIKCGFRKETARKFYTGKEILKFWRLQL